MRIALLTSAFVLASLGAPPAAPAGAPTDQLKEYTDQVVRILEDPGLKQPERRQERRAAVRKIAVEIFDVAEAARRALGVHWQPRTPAEREEFGQLFTDLLERTYINKIDLYGGESIRYAGDSIAGDRATVRARVVTRSGTEVPVESRMLRRGDRWLVYDVLIENVSLIANYRAQFDRIIRASSFQELVRRLKNNRNEFLNEARPPRSS